MPIPRAAVVLVAVVGIAFVDGACSRNQASAGRTAAADGSPSRRMLDGKEWTATNLQVDIGSSYCYEDAEANCGRYGRLYTWASAQHACASLGDRWRLPTDAEWRELARRYGGVSEDSADGGKAAYSALSVGGRSGFDALPGGDRDDGRFDRLGAHGFYWTASENDHATAPFYSFALGGQALHRQGDGDKQMASSVRCVRE